MKCPNCKSENIEFTESYKGANHIIFSVILVLFMILTIVAACRLDITIMIIGSALDTITIITWITTHLMLRRKSHTKAICKECGEIWYLD